MRRHKSFNHGGISRSKLGRRPGGEDSGFTRLTRRTVNTRVPPRLEDQEGCPELRAQGARASEFEMVCLSENYSPVVTLPVNRI